MIIPKLRLSDQKVNLMKGHRDFINKNFAACTGPELQADLEKRERKIVTTTSAPLTTTTYSRGPAFTFNETISMIVAPSYEFVIVKSNDLIQSRNTATLRKRRSLECETHFLEKMVDYGSKHGIQVRDRHIRVFGNVF